MKTINHLNELNQFLFVVIQVEIAIPAVDVYSPNRVTDLKVASIQVNQMVLTIEWTAPGDDLDQGTGPSSQFHVVDLIHFLLSTKSFDFSLCFTSFSVVLSD